jgi:hypothetical protein
MSRVLLAGIVLAGSVFLMSASCKEVSDTVVDEPITNVPGDNVNGVVTLQFAEEGCAVLIEAKVDGKKEYFIPVDLLDEFKVEGMKIVMTYHASRINQGSCLKGHPIIIDSIEKR